MATSFLNPRVGPPEHRNPPQHQPATSIPTPPDAAISTPQTMIHSQQMSTTPTGRRGFLKTVALAGVPLGGAAAAQTPPQTLAPAPPPPPKPVTLPRSSMRYPRIYTG